MELTRTNILMIVPIVLINLVLVVIAMVDLIKRKKVRYDNKILWGAVILLIQFIGPIFYFVIGRKEDEY